MRSVTLKMVLAFLGISLVSILLIVVMARWRTNTEFSRFVVDRKEADLVDRLKTYYRAKGSWDGIRRYFSINNAPNPETVSPRAPYFVLADENGRALSSGLGYRIGQQIPQDKFEQGIPIEVDGENVGALIVDKIPPEKNPREKEFLQRTNLMLVYSAVGASFIALLIGIILSRTLTRPIRELTEATHAVSEGELGAQVSVRSKDEMGELAASFNKMSADLARSIESRKQMTADIAHELRTPLSLIIGHADAVHDDVLPPSKENFEIIREEALRLEHLVDDLRTLSLADAGELRTDLQDVPLEKMLSDLQTAFQHPTSQKGITLHTALEPALPTLNIDPVRMNQVLTNILDNALHHTPEGGTITLSARSVQDGVEISIQDSGPGIRSDDANRIFSRFYRADEARNRDDGGSGLGLAIAKSIVLAHNGKIWAESAPGQGLTVNIKLPI